MCMLMVWCFGRFLHLVFSHITVTLIRKWWNLSRRYCTPKLPGFYLRVCYSVEEYSSGSLSLKPRKSLNKSSRLAYFCGIRGTIDLLGYWSWHWLIQKPSVNTETEWISVVTLGKWSDLPRVVRILLKLSYEASDRKIQIGHQRKYVLHGDIENNLYSLILYGLFWCEIPFAWTHGMSACPDLCAFSDLNIRSRKWTQSYWHFLIAGYSLGKTR